jgi:LysM repeat protein
MGSVKKPNWKQYGVFLLINVIVSALTVLLVLTIWDRSNPLPPVPATPTLDVSARLERAVPSSTPTVPPSLTPVTYTVKSGDTLLGISRELGIPQEALMAANGLTDPDALTVGQVLIIPSLASPTEPAYGTSPSATSPAPSSTSIPEPGDADVIIQGVHERGNLESEYIYLENAGGVAAMLGWSVDDGKGNVYIFPEFTLYTGGGVNLYTKPGTDSVINLFWGLTQPLWTPGTLITLRDAHGSIHSTFQVPEG